jgi:hypothetical protein
VIGFGLKITKARCRIRRAIGRRDKIVLLIALGEANVNLATARLHEAQKGFDRAQAYMRVSP